MLIAISIIFIVFAIMLLLIMFLGLSEEKWRKTYYNIKEEQQPNIQLLKRMRYKPAFMTKTIFADKNEHEAVRIKYHVTKANATNLEATMTTYQLYEANNILWAKNLTLNQIEMVLYLSQSKILANADETIRNIIEGKTK
jgi:hypothetical protein